MCVGFCTGNFAMVPLNFIYLHCLQHSCFEDISSIYIRINISTYKWRPMIRQMRENRVTLNIASTRNKRYAKAPLPLKLTYLLCLQHSFFEHFFNLYSDWLEWGCTLRLPVFRFLSGITSFQMVHQQIVNMSILRQIKSWDFCGVHILRKWVIYIYDVRGI